MNDDTPLILIGGRGFLGSAFAAWAEQAKREVHRIQRTSQVDPGERDWQWDEVDALADAMAGRAPVIVDLAYATVPSTSFADPVGDFTANLGSMIRHLEFSRKIGAARHIFLSSGGTVYGDQGDRLLDEDAPTQPISPYGITKLASEHYAGMYRRLGVPSLIVRPSNIFGPGQAPFRGQGLVATAFGAAMRGQPLTLYGDGSQRRDYLFVDDFCTGLDAVLARGEIGATYNLGCGAATATAALLAAIGTITARDGFPLIVTNADARAFDVSSNLLDIGRIRDRLGWQPDVALDDGLERTWQWIRNH